MTFRLQLLHASDLEGGLEAIDNAANFAALADYFERTFTPGAGANGGTLIISAGDNYIPGPFFNAGASSEADAALTSVFERFYNLPAGTLAAELEADSGRVDIAIMNLIGFDASAVGNHEFDSGTALLENFASETVIGIELGGPIAVDEFEWFGAQFPYLSANLDFSADASGVSFTNDIRNTADFQTNPSSQETLDNTANTPEKIAPAAIATVDGEDIGIIGLTTPALEAITSTGLVDVLGVEVTDQSLVDSPEVLQAMADLVNAQVARLQALGVDKIILTSHLQQFGFEQALAPLLEGVDIIIAGGSDSILADATDTLRPGDTADFDEYPVFATNADGDPVAIVSTDGEYSYLGRLVIEFDDNGVVIPDSVDENVSGSFATTDENVLAIVDDGTVTQTAGGLSFEADSVPDLVQELTDVVQAVVIADDSIILAESEVFLEGRRTQVRTEETNLANLIGDAQIFYARQFDETVQISIQNGGGLRAEIGSIVNEVDTGQTILGPTAANALSGKEEGEVSVLDVNNTLRFDNSLTLVTLDVNGILEQLENGVASTTEVFGEDTPGQFAQVSGLQFAFDPSLPSGSRITDVAVVDLDGTVLDVLVRDGAIVGDATRTFRVVTNSFIFGGGDGYTFEDLANADPAQANVVDLRNDTDGSFDPGRVDAVAFGGQQDALAEYLAFLAEQGTPYSLEETSVTEDLRIINLSQRDNVVADGVSLFRAYDRGEDFHQVFTSVEDLLAAQQSNGDLLFEGLLFETAISGAEADTVEIVSFLHVPSGSTALTENGSAQFDAWVASADFERIDDAEFFAFSVDDGAGPRTQVIEFVNNDTGAFVYAIQQAEIDAIMARGDFTSNGVQFFAFEPSTNVASFINDANSLTYSDLGVLDNPFTEDDEGTIAITSVADMASDLLI